MIPGYLLFAALSVPAPAAMPIHGSIQLWQATCTDATHCALPAAISDQLPVDGTVAAPAGPGQLQEFHTTLTSGAYQVAFQVYWVSPPPASADGSVPYLVAQARLVNGSQAITECTQYAGVDVATFFPVGACSGFVQDSSGTTQIGVTFYR